MTADNRDEIANQVREYFEQLISLANTQYSGSYLFSGQKSDTQAYGETLWMNSNDDTFDAAVDASGGFTISGDTDYTALVQFTGTDTVTHQPSFNYSLDGGETWVSNGTYTASATAGREILNLGSGLSLELSDSALDAVTAGTDTDSLDGTCMFAQLVGERPGPEVHEEYAAHLARVCRLIDDFVPDAEARTRIRTLCELKYRQALVRPTLIPSRLGKRLLTIFLTQSGLDDPHRERKRLYNRRAFARIQDPATKAMDWKVSRVTAAPRARATRFPAVGLAASGWEGSKSSFVRVGAGLGSPIPV